MVFMGGVAKKRGCGDLSILDKQTSRQNVYFGQLLKKEKGSGRVFFKTTITVNYQILIRTRQD